ncbi:deleted in malignant brain tumors 1 protein [Oreochromis niloticus]|uniref:deleted in malignant brain tumors 1 protein n=1 Tax=Oreochromis niloticus TaxID=8128 RepID=UPI000904C481|nr:deleted in malignant brain tumors 1 protein [Oreochromis niloticus]
MDVTILRTLVSSVQFNYLSNLNCLINSDQSNGLLPPFHVILLHSTRLAGSGSTRCSGRVEVYHNNSWGTVCGDGWDLNDTAVVCRELNCGPPLEATQFAYFGAGTGHTWLDNVTCSGNESSLTECQHSGWGTNNCGHDQDAGVICSGLPIRLAGSGLTTCSGRVEVYYNNSWGTVCGDGWDLNNAQVVCRQLNCWTALEAPQNAYFGEGTGQIWLDEVTCSGNESFLSDCQRSGFGVHDCDHSKDASVICSAPWADVISQGVTPSEKVASWRKFLVKVNLAAVDSSVDMKDPAVMESVINSVKNELVGTSGDLKVSWWKLPEKKDIKKQETCTP